MPPSSPIPLSVNTRLPRPLGLPSPVSPSSKSYLAFSPADDTLGRRHRRRIGPLRIILVGLTVLCLLGFSLTGSVRLRFSDMPQHEVYAPQTFRPNPSRIVASRHRTVLPPSLPRYHIACWGKWANGTTSIVPADEGVTDVVFEVFIEAPTKQVLEMAKYDDAGAQQRGVIAITLAGGPRNPIPEKWLKIHTRLLLPRNRTYGILESHFIANEPYWWRQSVGDLIDAGIHFGQFTLLTGQYGDINVTSLAADKAEIITDKGDIYHQTLDVPPTSLRVEAPKGRINPTEQRV